MAGGKGTRLRPLTDGLPKPLVPVLNTPIIDYSLALLKRFDINETAVTLQYLPEKIMEHLDASAYKDGLYYFVETAPLGTAGSVRNTGKFLDETFIVVSGDALTDINIEKMLSFHRANRADVTIAVKEVNNPSQFGVVCADSVGRVFGFKEKPKAEDCQGNTVSCGIYIMEPRVLEMIPENAQTDFARDLFPEMLEKFMRVFAYRTDDYWCDVGSIETYFKANMDVLTGAFNVSAIPSVTAGGRFIEDESGARIFTGGNVYIGENARLSGGVILGGGAAVNSGAVLSDCIIAEGAEVPAYSDLSSCIFTGAYKIDIGGAAAPDNIIPFTSHAPAPQAMNTPVRI